MLHHLPIDKSIFFFLLFLPTSPSLLAQANTLSGRIESEFKLDVPQALKGEVWAFLKEAFGEQNIQQLDSSFSASTSEEIFYDQYFDNEAKTLYQQWAGVRFRQRYLGDSLVKELVQLKLPLEETSGIARQEIKFNVYSKIKKTDRQAMHPFWRYVRPNNRPDVNLQLARFGLTGDDLFPAVKVKQKRNRVYILEKSEALATITFDEVQSFYFPYPQYTELELELNEVRFTEGTETERQRMEAINQSLKDQILRRFPQLQQNQTPKYNKMYDLLKDNYLQKAYDNLMYLILGVIVAYALFLYGQQSLQTKMT